MKIRCDARGGGDPVIKFTINRQGSAGLTRATGTSTLTRCLVQPSRHRNRSLWPDCRILCAANCPAWINRLDLIICGDGAQNEGEGCAFRRRFDCSYYIRVHGRYRFKRVKNKIGRQKNYLKQTWVQFYSNNKIIYI